MIIDSHQHFWNYNPERDLWIDDSMGVIRKHFLPKNLKPILLENGVDGCIAFQADQSHLETEFLLRHLDELKINNIDLSDQFLEITFSDGAFAKFKINDILKEFLLLLLSLPFHLHYRLHQENHLYNLMDQRF